MTRLTLVVVAVCLLVSCGSSDQETDAEAMSTVALASINDSLNLFDAMQTDELRVEILRLELARAVLRQTILIRSFNPDISSLYGGQLETLCLLSEPQYRRLLDEAGDPQLSSLAHAYIDSIELEVHKRIRDAQRTMKGKGCFIAAASL